MANRYPNTPVTGALSQLIDQLRKSFPASVTADTLKRLGIAPNNESYILNVLRFLDVLDADGAKTDAAKEVFSHHKDEEFEKGLAGLVQDGYAELFELYGDSAWSLPRDDLIHFFRQADESSEIVGKRQASTFEVLAEKAGRRGSGGQVASPEKEKNRKPKPRSPATKKRTDSEAGRTTPAHASRADEVGGSRDVGLTVRVEVNLPAEGDQATYDRIFKSIRQYLID